MRNLKLINLDLENFMGIKDFTLEANGEDLKILGDNATGKTTIFSGFLWLLFGENNRRSSQFDIKPVTKQDSEALVKGVFKFDGEEFTLTRSYGDNYNYSINGVPKKKSEFKNFLSQKFDLTRARLLVNPRYFNEGIDWKSRREILMNLVEGVETTDMIETNSELEELDLQGLEPGDRREQLKAEIKDLEEEKKNIPVQIQTLQENAPEFEDEEPDDIGEFLEFLKDEKESLVKQKKDLEEQIADLKSSGRQAELRQKKNEIEAAMDEFEQEWKSQIKEDLEELEEERKETSSEFHQVKRKMDELEDEKERAKDQIEEIENELKELRASYHETEECPLCGHEITEDEEDGFRTSVQLRGKKKRNEKETLENKVDDLNSELGKFQEKRNDLEEGLDGFDETIENLEDQKEQYSGQPEYLELQDEFKDLEQMIEQGEKGPSEELKEKKQALNEVNQQIDEQNQAIARAKEYRRILDKVGQLKAKESKLAGKLETLKNQLRLVNEFVKTKANILESSINQKFDLVNFKLFEEYKSKPGVKEICKTTVDSVSWDTLNNAGQMKGGLDIIKTLGREWNLEAPVWLDNSESVVEIPEGGSHQIELEVREGIGELKVE